MEKQRLLNTYVNNVTMEQAIGQIERFIETGKKSYVVAVNVDVIMKIEKDSHLKEITDKADLTLVDGKPLVWISKWLKKPVREKISGSDMVPILCKRAAEREYSVFIMGGKEGVAEQAKKNLEKEFPQIKIAGTYAPPFGFENDKKELDKINEIITERTPDILLACLGCPKQEKWVYENYQKYEAKVSVCAGATVDFLSGNVKRAPEWMSEYGLEWLYRFIQEPKRLFKRYFVDDVKIFRLAWKYR